MSHNQSIILGGGCFWCTEAVFDNVKGILSVKPGYSGGTKKEPTYDEVCSGTTGHAEVIKVEFDESQISLSDILEIFFAVHDPTTLNKQGNDVGGQYRSIILYNNDVQKQGIEKYIQELNESKPYKDPIVTELKQVDEFYEAEVDHHEYYKKHKGNPYCEVVIDPKIQLLRKKFSTKVK